MTNEGHYTFEASVPAKYDGVKLLNLAFNLTAEKASVAVPVAKLSQDGKKIFVDASKVGFGSREAKLLGRSRTSSDIRSFLTRMFRSDVYYELTNTPVLRREFRENHTFGHSVVEALGAGRLFGQMLLIVDSGVSEAPREIRIEESRAGRMYTSLDRDVLKYRSDYGKDFNPRDPFSNPIDNQHDGEEVIRLMKNGLMQFSLWDTYTGRRIDIAPKNIAHDRSGMSREGAGSLISNPLSCLDCHGQNGFQAHEWASQDLPELLTGSARSERSSLMYSFKGINAYESVASTDNATVKAALERANASELHTITDFIQAL